MSSSSVPGIDRASADKLLTTTRSVRKRLDLDRPVEASVIQECIDIALQAPTGTNAQNWAFVVVTDAAKRKVIADTSRGLAEMARVCRPGGTLAILEFALPDAAVVRGAYLWYFRNVLPRLGNAVARNASDAYTYLNRSVEAFPSGAALARLVEAAGFGGVVQHPLTFGIAALTLAERRPGRMAA